MNRFEKIKNDKTIIEVYNKISEYEDLYKGWAYHNLDHVKNVAKLVESLHSELGYDDSFIEEAKIAALLHDTGAIEGKNNHSLRSYEFAKKYFEKNNIILKNKDLNDAKELANLAANDSKLSVGIGVNSKGDVSLTINKLKEEAPLFFINLEKGNTCLRSLGANGARLVKGMPLKNI